MIRNEWVKIVVGLSIGLVIIIWLNPLHTPCQSQRDLYKEAIMPMAKAYSKGLKDCRELSDPGHCLPLFEVIAKLNGKIGEMESKCLPELESDDQTRQWLEGSLRLMTHVAWGTKAPTSYLNRNGWFELTQLVLYCKLRKSLDLIYGDGAWNRFAGAELGDMPGAEQLERGEAWNRSVMADPCKYPL